MRNHPPEDEPTESRGAPRGRGAHARLSAQPPARGSWSDQPSLRLRLAILLSEEISWPHKLRTTALIERWAEVTDEELAAALRATPRVAAAVRRAACAARPLAELELRRVAGRRASILTPLHEDFPERLLDLENPPLLLYLRRREEATGVFSSPSISMVGPRNADPHALDCASRFAGDLAGAGITVVSGFARGVDLASHRAAAEVGATVAVLGCGLEVPYPGHHDQADEIVRQGGAVLSEFPLQCEPQRWHFPLRNRLIAALGDATLVVQASRRSGSLLTAHAALELGRDVWAVPGRLTDARSRGSNLLLRDGAGIALCSRDLIEALPPRRRNVQPHGEAGEAPAALLRATAPDQPEPPVRERLDHPGPAGTTEAAATAQLSPAAARLLGAMGQRAASVERLAQRSDLEIPQVLAALGELELEARVERRGVDLFRVARD